MSGSWEVKYTEMTRFGKVLYEMNKRLEATVVIWRYINKIKLKFN